MALPERSLVNIDYPSEPVFDHVDPQMRGYQPTTTMNAFSTDAALHFPNDENQLFSQVMFFSPSQYPESIAYWHDISLSTPPIPVVDPTSTRSTSLINQAPVKQRKYKRTRSGCFTCRLRRVKVKFHLEMFASRSSFLTERS